MKKILRFFFAFLVTFSTLSAVWATPAQETMLRFKKIYESTQQVDECSGPSGSTSVFGEKGKEISIITLAKMGSIMVGDDKKAYKLAADKGNIQVYENGRWKSVTYRVDSQGFLAQLKAMHNFVNQALLVAQKNGEKKYVKQVTCASKVIEFTQVEHKTKSKA